MKRVFDCALAALLLVAVSPVIIILAILVRISSNGPAIFIQSRVGLHASVFNCYKLRTMIVGTINVPTHLAEVSHVTAIGKFLRRTKLDELPQLWNVLRGDMSLVGPRPCLPTQSELICERRRRGVLNIRPGITGLAQIRGVDMSDPVLLAKIDAEYLRDSNFIYDLKILFRTIFEGGKRQKPKPLC